MRNAWLFCFIFVGGICSAGSSSAGEFDAPRKKAQKQLQEGNYKVCLATLKTYLFDAKVDEKYLPNDFNMGLQCLRNLGQLKKIDAYREKVLKAHPENWRLKETVAQSYLGGQHYGFVIAGKFERGQHRGGGTVMNSAERDRVRALQLMDEARAAVTDQGNATERGGFYHRYARFIQSFRGYGETWRLQYLSDLKQLPDYAEGYGYGRRHWGGTASKGAPVDQKGNPIYYRTPESWELAKNDGERWRWLLAEAAKANPALEQAVTIDFAGFLKSQFGVQTMASYGAWFFRPMTDTGKDEARTWDLHTLKSNETIAKLATGVKRFTLPEEFNFVGIYTKLAEVQKEKKPGGWNSTGLNHLAEISQNRRQYPQAAKYWKQSKKAFGDQGNNKQAKIDQILKPWGQFESVSSQLAGKGATAEYKFRNGDQVSFVAHRIHTKQLLDDAKAHLKTNPKNLRWQKVNIQNIGYRLVQEEGKKYIGEKVANWKMPVKPLKDHFDRRVTVSSPLQEPGAYWVTAKMQGGNTSQIILWVSDTVIVKKPVADKNGSVLYYVADAETGKPIAKATLSFFGYWQEHHRDRKNKKSWNEIHTHEFAEFSDADGQVIPSNEDVLPAKNRSLQYLVTATTEDGRFAHLGFSHVWRGNYHDAEYKAIKGYGITDRPVYRPEHKVQFKAWVRHAQYDKEDQSRYAGKSFEVKIHNPKNEEVFKQTMNLDQWGGLQGAFELPEDAALGVYRIHLRGAGHSFHSTTFRVEEYKKPEFEVTIEAPDAPVMLGEKIPAKVMAKYYFGAPVTKGKAKIKVTRSAKNAQWFAPGPWDWFYGPGYWWFGYNYEWYPGWRGWGCIAPHPSWWNGPNVPPEVVLEVEKEMTEDGVIEVEIDTALAKAIHGDEDHAYTITAEITDESRRTIVGTGEVLVARKPFKVHAWVDRGHYRVGEVIKGSFNARTLDGKPVEGKGDLVLYAISYKEGKDQPIETEVQRWKVPTNDRGEASQQLKASKAGQYRLSYTLNDGHGHKIEGGYIFVVRGQGFDGKEFRFNHLELVVDKESYQPGEEVNLMINTDRVGGTVVLFIRPANGIYLKPEIIRMAGKSTTKSIKISKKDMPNFFIEAFTIHNGQVFSETREVIVPPEKRVINVAVEPSKKEYKPGEEATLKLRLTDAEGKPFVGSTVVSVYDKSVEYISGGSNIPEIRAFFWKWRRHHRPQTEHSLQRQFTHLGLRGKPQMQPLGVFGNRVQMHGLTFGNGAIGSGGGGEAHREGLMMEDQSAGMDMASPAPAAAPGRMRRSLSKTAEKKDAGAPAMVQPKVRSNFADTAFWVASLDTNDKGEADVSFTMPENLSGWKIRTWAMGHGTRVGEGTAEVVTAKNLLIRLQAPRFFVQKDEVVLSGNIHNYLDEKKTVNAVIEFDGSTLELIGDAKQVIEIEAGGEKRVDWRVRVKQEGEAVVRMKALTDTESDAMQMSFPVYVHGMLKTESWSRVIRPRQNKKRFTIRVPEDRRPDETRLEIRYSPTLAGAMVDALPYLVDYPYGCTEQTLNRFLPTVMVQNVLKEMGIDLADVKKKRTNLNAQEIGEDRERAKQWKRFDRNPVFDEKEVDRMVKKSLTRLYSMQLSDGGWGWFSGHGEHSSPHTTAYVLHGFQMAETNGLAIVPDSKKRGLDWLVRYQEQQYKHIQNPKHGKKAADNLDAFIYMVLVDADRDHKGFRDQLYKDRLGLAVYAKAMLGLAYDKLKAIDRRDMLIQNVEQFLKIDKENQTAYLELANGGYWWYWYGSEYEAQAYYLKLLARTKPKSPQASGLVKYLLNNRKHSTYWNSTRDTAICIEAMAEYWKASGEDKPDLTVEVVIDGKVVKEVAINSDNLFTFDNKFVIEGRKLSGGKHQIELRKKGKGPLYFNAYLTNFTLEDFIKKAGLEVKVQRKVYRLVPVEKSIKAQGAHGQAVDQKVEKYKRVLLKNNGTVKSGDLLEIELEIDSKNDYEYLIFEDMKASGTEPVEVRSGYARKGLRSYVEYRDEKVAFFVQNLARGKHSVSYRVRAEIPGTFSALPTRAYAMYAPELKANSDELKFSIKD